MQDLLDILYGEGRMLVSSVTGKIIDLGEKGNQQYAIARYDIASDSDGEAGNRPVTISAKDGELLLDVKHYRVLRNGTKLLLGTNFKGERGVLDRGDIFLHKSIGLGKKYLRAVEEYLEGSRESGMDGRTIIELRHTFHHISVLSEVQMWLILQALNAQFGMSYGLGVIKSGFVGGWKKKDWVKEWEGEIRRTSSGEVFFPWKQECFMWEGGKVVESYLSVNPCREQTKMGKGDGALVWVHNDGFEERGWFQEGIESAVAHWEAMGQEEWERGQECVDGWDVKKLLCKQGECWRVKEDAVLFEGGKVVVNVGVGSFVWFRKERVVGEKDGRSYLFVETCSGEDKGWIREEFVEAVVAAAAAEKKIVVETSLAVSENTTNDNNNNNNTTTPTKETTKRKVEDVEERAVKKGRSEEKVTK